MSLLIILKYFTHFCCMLNFVTVLFLFLKLNCDNSSWAYEFSGNSEHYKTVSKHDNTLADPKEAMVWSNIGPNGKLKHRHNNIHSARYIHRHTLVSKEKDSLMMRCQLLEQFPWSKCEWKHKRKSITIFHDTDNIR